MEKKICSKCKIEKDVVDFNKRKNRKSKYTSQCKLCICENGKKYRDNNLDLIKSRRKCFRLRVNKIKQMIRSAKYEVGLKTKNDRNEAEKFIRVHCAYINLIISI